MSWDLVVRQKFSAAHFLEHYQGKCEKMHGHTFEMEVHFRTLELDRSGISVDFGEIKEYLRGLVPDHKVLNEVYDFSPSAENLARYFFEQIKLNYPVIRVMIWESDDAGAAYAEDQ
ncbi:MAG: 6-carboxytetrahydropterin synthase [Candidatus Aminicenantes bacterium]|nr:6-carboxytetrahydropterin synthase [Acidobacteriota bacterium]MCG2812715.1 6-carboxytetrahydropterin synthase [Candidatus Aminicenantes bacterium]